MHHKREARFDEKADTRWQETSTQGEKRPPAPPPGKPLPRENPRWVRTIPPGSISTAPNISQTWELFLPFSKEGKHETP